MKWWTERMEPWLVAVGDRWGARLTDWLRKKFNIPKKGEPK